MKHPSGVSSLYREPMYRPIVAAADTKTQIGPYSMHKRNIKMSEIKVNKKIV